MKGQAAIEYLMTYGWAVLILVSVLGLLYSMGVLNPQSYAQEECIFQPSLRCDSLSLDPNGNVKVSLINGMGFPINLNDYSISYKGQECSSTSAAREVDPDEVVTLSAQCKGNFYTGDVYNFKVTLEYTVDGNSDVFTSSGQVSIRAS